MRGCTTTTVIVLPVIVIAVLPGVGMRMMLQQVRNNGALNGSRIFKSQGGTGLHEGFR